MVKLFYRQGCRPARVAVGRRIGFTFIELLIVVALIALISYLGLPYFKPYLQYSWLEKDAWQLMADLRAYRQQSIIDHFHYRFVFDPAGDSYLIEKRNAATNELVETKPRVTLTNNLVSANELTFRPRGETDQASTIRIQGKNSSQTATITVFATTGLAKLELF